MLKKYFFKHTPLEKTPLCFHFLLLGQNVGDFNEPHRSRYHWRTHRSHAFQVLSYFYEDTSRWEECQLLKGYTKLSESKSWTWIHEFFWNSNSFYSHTSYASQQSSVCIAVLATVFYITTVLVRYPKAGYFYTERERLYVFKTWFAAVGLLLLLWAVIHLSLNLGSQRQRALWHCSASGAAKHLYSSAKSG